MKRTIIIGIVIMSMLAIASANTLVIESGEEYEFDLIAGNNYTFETDIEQPGYAIRNNTYNLSGLEMLFDGQNIIMSTKINYKPDNFTIIFYDMEDDRDTPSGGGSRINRTVYKNRTENETEYIEVPDENDTEEEDYDYNTSYEEIIRDLEERINDLTSSNEKSERKANLYKRTLHKLLYGLGSIIAIIIAISIYRYLKEEKGGIKNEKRE